MTRKNSLTKKEKLYVLGGLILLLVGLFIIGTIIYNNLRSDNDVRGRIQMNLKDSRIISGDETSLTVTVTNTGNKLMAGDLLIVADDPTSVNVSHQDPNVLNVKLYPGESVTRIFSIVGTTNAIRTDYKIFAEIRKDNETISSNEVVLTVTRE
jgi:uncharacterized membrane protein